MRRNDELQNKHRIGDGRLFVVVIVFVVFTLMTSLPAMLEASAAVRASVTQGKTERRRSQATKKTPTAQPAALKELMNSFVRIPAGEFMMGKAHGRNSEIPVHRVHISRSFDMSKYEVTQAQWETVMGRNPSYFKGANLPVEQVSWFDVQEFIKKLNTRDDGHVYRLPSDAEWEYACHAGSTGDFAGDLDAMAWYGNNSGNTTHPVGTKQPNTWGLYDMQGNVDEWVQDRYSDDYYAQSPSVDPQGPNTGSERVIRGGRWNNNAQSCRSTLRYGNAPDGRFNILGFRLVRTLR